MESENRGLDLEKELTCSICTEVLYQPLTLLDCLHTYCGSCLKEWFGWQLASARNEPNTIPAGSTPYTCPSCRAPVRATKHDAKVATLVEMFVAANPDKGKTAEEIEEIKRKYTPGENVQLKVATIEKSLRERRVDDEDRRLMNEVRTLSLREAGIETSEVRRERRRREEGRSHGSRSQSSRDNSRDGRTTEERERRRRREAEAERRRVRDGTGSGLRPEGVPTEDRRRRRSDEEAARRRDEVTSRTARQIEHQSSLRSLISSSDADSREMEEEILRQIREEGLLDGIDLENIDVNQEDQISERIAEAFRRRQSERQRLEPARRSDASRRSDTSGRRHHHSSAPESRESSGDDRVTPATATRRRRTHSRATSAVSQREEQSRPPPSMSAVQAAHLDVNSSDESSRRRRRTTSNSRSSTTPIPVTEPDARPTARSQTDLSNRPQSYHMGGSRPLMMENSRSSTDPIAAQQIFELPTSGKLSTSRPSSQQILSPKSSPRIPAPAEQPSSPVSLDVPRTRAAPPADIFVPASTPSAVSQPAVDQGLQPAPLSPRMHDTPRISPSDRATAMGSASWPTSSSPTNKTHLEFFPEPSLTCARCEKTHIEYELHYNCGICKNGNYNICFSCYRFGKGCLNWFGFGQDAFENWKNKNLSGILPLGTEEPHMLRASRYVAPKIPEGGADGRRTLTTDDPEKRLQSGVFCSNCLTWANECFWSCMTCNAGDWGFCNSCVNQGKSCTHSLLPMTYFPPPSDNPPLTPTHDREMPRSATISVNGIGNFKYLTFSTACDICHYPIPPSVTRYHCYECISKDPNNSGPGDYDICTACYAKLETSRRISAENGHNGWRRCLAGHRMIICGFQDTRGGQCRAVVQNLVGGQGVIIDPSPIKDHVGGELQQWSWGDGKHRDGDEKHKKLVTTDVMRTAPTTRPDFDNERGFPPDGGVGMIAVADWPRYPREEDDDELLFPKGAELREVKDVSGEWFHGAYMGKVGLLPSNHVHILDTRVGS